MAPSHIAGVRDGFSTMRRLSTSIVGPVAHVSEILDRREAGQWVIVTLTDGTSREVSAHRWFAVHPRGSWGDGDQADAPPDATPVEEPAAETGASEEDPPAVKRNPDRHAHHRIS